MDGTNDSNNTENFTNNDQPTNNIQNVEIDENNINPNVNLENNYADDDQYHTPDQSDDDESASDYDQYFINTDEVDDDQDEDDLDDETDESSSNQSDNNDNYDNSSKPENINYDTELPTSHYYLGNNFQHIIKPKAFYDYNEEITIPLLNLPGNNWNNNSVQLLPGQTMPMHFYSPLQIQIIRKTMENADHLIGILLNADDLKVLSERLNEKNKKFLDENSILGVLAEIISISSETEDNTSLMYGGEGIIIKVKGRDRFRITEIRREITGCIIATVKILPEHVLNINPLIHNSARYNEFYFKNFLNNNLSNHPKTEIYNTFSTPSWIFRIYDCSYIINLITHELDEVFKIKIDSKNLKEKEEFKESKNFSSWLLSNFPFDNTMRINCLKIDCLNQRLMYMYKLIRSFTNINCARCKNVLCSKSDVFCISKEGFMTAYLNPGGIIHETLTVYKIKNFTLTKAPPSTEFSWFPGYGWQICSCCRCKVHIGWKYTSMNSTLKPDKFWGLTRNAIRYTYDDTSNEDLKMPSTDSIAQPIEPQIVSSS